MDVAGTALTSYQDAPLTNSVRFSIAVQVERRWLSIIFASGNLVAHDPAY